MVESYQTLELKRQEMAKLERLEQGTPIKRLWQPMKATWRTPTQSKQANYEEKARCPVNTCEEHNHD